jgi:hypothetical protein
MYTTGQENPKIKERERHEYITLSTYNIKIVKIPYVLDLILSKLKFYLFCFFRLVEFQLEMVTFTFKWWTVFMATYLSSYYLSPPVQHPAVVSGMRKLTKPDLYAVNRRRENNLYSIMTALPPSAQSRNRRSSHPYSQFSLRRPVISPLEHRL